MEVVFEFMLMLICNYPGGIIRWILFRRKPLRHYLDDWEWNAFTVVILVLAIIALNKLCITG